MEWLCTGVRKGMSVTWDTHGTVLNVQSCHEKVSNSKFYLLYT